MMSGTRSCPRLTPVWFLTLSMVGWSAITALAAPTVSPPATPKPISPAAGSDAVLAVRSGTEGVLRLDYRKESDGQPSESVTAGIASDYNYIRSGPPGSESLNIADYQLRRVFEVRSGNIFVNNSLYGLVWFQASELQNREVLSRAMNKAGLAKKVPATSNPFWYETELSLTGRDPPPQLKRVEEQGRTRWLLNDEEVTAARFGTQRVPDEVKPGLRKFWLRVAHVHPQIAADLAAGGQVPTQLWIKTLVHGKQAFETFQTWHWSLTGSQWESRVKYPLPPGLAAAPTTAEGTFPEIFATLSAAVAKQLQPPPDDIYLARAEAAIAHNSGLEALLWSIEMGLAHGTAAAKCSPQDPEAMCSLAVRAGPLAKTDPRTAVAFAERSPPLAARAQFQDLPNTYMLRLLWATRPPGEGVDFAENERGVLAALEASPVANFCKDTGDLYAKAWRPLQAWQAYDLGRQMAGHRSGDLLESIDTLEARLATDLPQEF